MVEQFFKEDQEGWFHDHSDWSGFYHTYPYFKRSDPLNQPRKIHVFLPRDYQYTEEAYPVIYINDGNTTFFPGGAYQKTWNLAKLLTRLYVSHRIRKVIAVAISPLNRDYEYTHVPTRGQDWGGIEDYSRYLAQSVKVFIDSNYRTLVDPKQTLMMGSSHGGLAAFYTALSYPDYFGNVAAFSPSFWLGLDSVTEQSDFDVFDNYFGSLVHSPLITSLSQTLMDFERRPKIYLDWGLVREGGNHNRIIEERTTVRGREMKSLLIEKFGYQEHQNLWVVEDPEGQHDEISWVRRLEAVLPLFYPS